MLRIVSGFKIGWRWGEPHPSTERCLTEEQAEKIIEKHSEAENVPAVHYRIFPCFLLEVQPERGPIVFFDLGNPVDVKGI